MSTKVSMQLFIESESIFLSSLLLRTSKCGYTAYVQSRIRLLIRRAGSTLNLNRHFHMLYEDPLMIAQILTHLGLLDEVNQLAFQLPEAQGPPQEVFF